MLAYSDLSAIAGSCENQRRACSFSTEMEVEPVRGVGQFFTYLVLRVFVAALQAVSMETCQQAARLLAWLAHDRLRIRAAVVQENLAIAFPELSANQRERIARRMWEHLFLFVAEVAHAPRKIHETNWRDYVRLNHAERLCRIALSERPSLVVSAHFGNFELGGFLLGVLGFPTYTVARTLDNPHLDAFLNRFRGGTGQRMIPKKGGYEQIVSVLAGGGMMTFLADQYAGSKGCWIEFFGRPASAHKAIALFALDNEAPVMVGSTRRLAEPLHFELAIHATLDPRSSAEAADVKRLTQWYTSQLEQAIRSAPEQYWWLHRRWKDNRAKHRARRAVA